MKVQNFYSKVPKKKNRSLRKKNLNHCYIPGKFLTLQYKYNLWCWFHLCITWTQKA